ncbi:MAG TPA: hypothetical protein VFM38_06535 [Candidatus Limnocylindrales bacterium]|nr:hypothetical protein [Candidatus Limnocylindrales bacterium]
MATRTPGPLPTLETADDPVVENEWQPVAHLGNQTAEAGAFGRAGTYSVQAVCSGPGDLAIDVVPSTPGGHQTVPCDASVGSWSIEVVDGDARLEVTAPLASAWHVLGVRLAPQPTPTPSPTPPTPSATPYILEASDCRPAPDRTTPPTIRLVANGEAHRGVAGTWDWDGAGSDSPDIVPPETVAIPGWSAAEIRIGGGECAIGWQIQAAHAPIDPAAFTPVVTIASHQPATSPDAVRTRQLPLDGIAGGRWWIRATLWFDRGDVTVYWVVRTRGFLFGRGLLVSDPSLEGLASGCASWQVGDVSASDSCGPIPWPVDSAPRVETGTGKLTFAIPGWAITGQAWWVRVTDAGGESMVESAEGIVRFRRERSSVTLEPPAGDLLLAVDVIATRPGASFHQTYVFDVVRSAP